ncbi:tyrosine-protein phosphatase [Streptomyces sp. NPDC088251]|uniref:tyrosine-protein phosphatase n=1 Tax=Streptomyces sp. NPDC088251 TaxID=3365844 RepID=UPI00381C6E5E
MRPGTVFRTGWTLLAGCPDADAPMNSGRWYVDLRSSPERELLTEGARWRLAHVPVDMPGVAARLRGRPTSDDYVSLYQDMARSCGTEIAAVVGVTANRLSQGVVLGCSLGKDRTGVVIALLLKLLGVPVRDILIADTAALEKASGCPPSIDAYARQRGIDGAELIRRMRLGTPALESLLAMVDECYGGVEPYLREHGVSGTETMALRRGLLV